MTDRPILFSAAMVRAQLEGRKTQTRRIIKPQPGPCDHKPWPGDYEPRWKIEGSEMHCSTCGNGVRLSRRGDGAGGIPLRFAKGDRLWVREAWAEVGSFDPGLIVTRADYPACVPRHFENVPAIDQIKWKPGIHMRRTASRLTWTVTDVRVQRLREISEADAVAEGATSRPACSGFGNRDEGWSMNWVDTLSDRDQCLVTARWAFANLWEKLHGVGAWDCSNPWVVAITGTVEQRNIDA